LPNFFGVCVYAFMCHHSLPSIITPIRSKENFKKIITSAYICIVVFYFLLAYTGIFAFGDDLNDFYTLNFSPIRNGKQSVLLQIIDYYLSLFPVFTISASFPIIGITLRNNLKSLYMFAVKKQITSNDLVLTGNETRFINFGLPLLVLVPPFLISLITHDLQLLVGLVKIFRISLFILIFKQKIS
jgi:amino acid permease